MSRQTYRVILWGLAALYICWSALVGFWATAIDAPISDIIANALNALYAAGIPRFITYPVVEVLANVGFFVPIGALLSALLARRFSLVALTASVAFSGVIELGQLLFLPGRYASFGDIAANSLGAAIGVATVMAVRVAVQRRRILHRS